MAVDVSKLNQPTPLASTDSLGDLSARRLNVRDSIDLGKLDAQRQFTPKSFVDELISRLVLKSDGQTVTRDELAGLQSDDRSKVVAGLVELNRGFFSRPTYEQKEEADGSVVSREVGREIVVPRLDDESDEEYLLRGWREQTRERAQQIKATADFATSGLGEAVRRSITPDVLRNASASMQLAEQLRAMGLGSGMIAKEFEKLGSASGAMNAAVERTARSAEGLMRASEGARLVSQKPPELRLPPIPRNPVLDTNEILDEVREEISQMRELAATQAEMQQSLNEVARTILVEFGKGAEASAKSSNDTLRVAQISLAVAVITAILTLVAIAVAVGLSNTQGQSQEAEQRREMQLQSDSLAAQREQSAAFGRLADALEKQNDGAAKAKTPDAKPK